MDLRGSVRELAPRNLLPRVGDVSRAVAIVAVAAAVVLLLGCAGHHKGHRGGHHGKGHGFESDASFTQVVTTQIGGKNVFIPSTIIVASGVPHTLSLYNTTDAPHGFMIEGLDITMVLYPGMETKVELPAMDGHRIFHIHCHLHPPHRTATLVVVPGKSQEK